MLVERQNKTIEDLKAVTKELVGKQICTVNYSNISTWFWMCGRPEDLLWAAETLVAKMGIIKNYYVRIG